MSVLISVPISRAINQYSNLNQACDYVEQRQITLISFYDSKLIQITLARLVMQYLFYTNVYLYVQKKSRGFWIVPMSDADQNSGSFSELRLINTD